MKATPKLIALLVINLSVFSIQCPAQNIWTAGGTSNEFHDSGNWSLGTIPNGSTDIVYSLAGSHSVVLSSNAEANEVLFDNGVWEIDGGHGLCSSNGFDITGSAVTVTGANTLLFSTSPLSLFNTGASMQSLTLANGAIADVFSINVTGNSLLNISNSSASAASATVFSAAGHNPPLSVVGTEAELNVAVIIRVGVSTNAMGTLNAFAGANVNTTTFSVGGMDGFGDVTIDGVNTCLDAESLVTVNGNSSILRITNGAKVVSGFCRIGHMGMGEIQVFGTNSRIETGGLGVGETFAGIQGHGVLRIQSGAQVDVTGSCTVDPGSTLVIESSSLDANSLRVDGTVSFPSGFANVSGRVSIGEDGIIEALTFSPANLLGDVNNDGEIFVVSNGRINLFGDYYGTGEFSGAGAVYFKAGVNPGDDLFTDPAIATVEVGGNVVLEQTAIANFQIAGPTLSDYDILFVGGDVDIQGSQLNLEIVDEYFFTDGQQFTIIELDGISTGTFAGLPEGAVIATSNCTNLTISYVGGDGNDVVVTAVGDSVRIGDVNLDGQVDLLDVQPFVNSISTGVFQIEADINKDGSVNLLDVEPFVLILSGD